MKPLLILADCLVRSRAGGPRRFLDGTEAATVATVLAQRVFETDEELEHFFQHSPGKLRRAWNAARLLWSKRTHLRAAEHLYCLDHMAFNLLLIAARTGLFDARGKKIRRFTFRDHAMQHLLPWLVPAPSFQVDLITREQAARWQDAAGGERAGWLPWRIDMEWYQPVMPAPDGPLLLPGNAYRDDRLVRPLLEAGLSVTRAGRSRSLQEKLADCSSHPGFALMINASHPAYREALRGARAVVLPILPCDEPAGLTAAMEAIACAVPLLANRSMGISELLAECEYPLPMVETLEPSAWITACETLQSRLQDPQVRADLARSRELLLRQRAIRPGSGDWLELFDPQPDARVPAIAPQVPA